MLNWISYSSLVPPNLFMLLAMIGVLCAWRWRRAGLILATAAMACLYLASTPLVSYWLIGAADRLADIMPRLPAAAAPGAIVVLSAEVRPSSLPGGKDVPGPLTLERLAEAAREQRRTGLPILTSGGWLPYSTDPMAATMARSLENDFGVPVKWQEERSRTTYENAVYSAEILRRAGISTALVVTNSWHMARALWSFYAAGFSVEAAPSPENRVLAIGPSMLFPQVTSLLGSYYATHELIGLGWYIVRGELFRT
jgi:uncharacterized SAM-binding protein YcdF (DUF218 family)